MPRNSGCRTGQKDKKRKRVKFAAEDGAKQTPRLEALEAAAAAPEAAAIHTTVNDCTHAETVRQWLDDLLYQVEDKVDFECRMHEQYHGAALACAEAIKRRTFGRQLAWNQGGEAQ